MNRRRFLGTAGSALAASVAGCLTGEPEPEDDEHGCFRERWDVVLYNESETRKSVTVTITDDAGDAVFADTVDVEPGTDRSTGTELDTQVSYAQSYTFEATLADGEDASTETVVNCGNVYISVTESGELEIRGDDHKGD